MKQRGKPSTRPILVASRRMEASPSFAAQCDQGPKSRVREGHGKRPLVASYILRVISRSSRRIISPVAEPETVSIRILFTLRHAGSASGKNNILRSHERKLSRLDHDSDAVREHLPEPAPAVRRFYDFVEQPTKANVTALNLAARKQRHQALAFCP